MVTNEISLIENYLLDILGNGATLEMNWVELIVMFPNQLLINSEDKIPSESLLHLSARWAADFVLHAVCTTKLLIVIIHTCFYYAGAFRSV